MERMPMLHPTQATDPVWAEEAGTAVEVEVPSEDQWFAWLNWLVAAAIAVAILFLQGRWLTPNVYTVPFGRCDIDWHVDRGIVAVACVGRDMIKVAPLPVKQPWWEDDILLPPDGGRGRIVPLPSAEN
jgi:hypothetical protein